MQHLSVLLDQTIDLLQPQKNGIYVDATAGGGGHSAQILSVLNTGKGFLYCFDVDDQAIEILQTRLQPYHKKYQVIRSNFSHLTEQLQQLGVTSVNGILFDLGLSSFQIDQPSRGFSYMHDAPLDMRMDNRQTLTALEIVNTYSYEQLTKIFYTYGEESHASPIANAIIKSRPLQTTFDLVRITDKINYDRKGHSAKKVFQALRLAVNDELGALERALVQAVALLAPHGRLAVITFHSLEDRIVKHYFKELTTCQVPAYIPLKASEMVTPFQLITKKGVQPTPEEILNNPRSHSARLRVIEKN